MKTSRKISGDAKPRILVIGARGIPDAEGGAEKNAEALFPRLVQRGFDVTLMGLKQNIKAPCYKGVTLKAAPTFRVLKTDKLAYYVAAIGETIRLKPDIVHLQGLGAAIFLLVYKMLGRTVVVRYGSADYILPKWGIIGRLGFLFSEWQLRYADAVISVAPSLSSRLASKGISENVHMIPNALDYAYTPPVITPTQSRPYILMVGRVTHQKNVGSLIKAFCAFSEIRPEYDLYIAGGLDDEKYANDLKQMANEKIKFLGRIPRSQVPDLLRGAELFVNVSLHEGSSNATLEAISYDKPVLLSAIPENYDMELPPQIYVDPNDHLAIASGMLNAISEPEKYRIEKNKFLDWEQVCLKTATIYMDLLELPNQ